MPWAAAWRAAGGWPALGALGVAQPLPLLPLSRPCPDHGEELLCGETPRPDGGNDGHRPQHRGGGREGGRSGGGAAERLHVPGVVARVRRPRGAAASQEQRRHVPFAGPPRAHRGSGGRGIPGAAPRVLPRRRHQSTCRCCDRTRCRRRSCWSSTEEGKRRMWDGDNNSLISWSRRSARIPLRRQLQYAAHHCPHQAEDLQGAWPEQAQRTGDIDEEEAAHKDVHTVKSLRETFQHATS